MNVATWRLLVEDGATAAEGLAVDELLARRVGSGESPPTLRLYTYRPHCALVGRFQDVPNELHVDFCARHDVAINRRPTGGGAIVMGPDQLGVALAVPGRRGDGLTGGARALMQRFSAGLVRGLGILGVHADFRGKNDLAVAGRKIAGLGVHREPSGGLLFHASLLVDLDVAFMARVLRLPGVNGDACDADAAELALLATRTTTVRECLLRAVDVAEVRGRIAAGFAGAFGVELEAGELDAGEEAQASALARDKYRTAGWVHQERSVPDAEGHARLRTPAGHVEANVALAGKTIKAVYLRGDFFEAAGAIAELEGRLRWHPAAAAAVEATVTAWAEAWPPETVPAAAFAAAINAAIEAAAPSETGATTPSPYGCFVVPQAGSDA